MASADRPARIVPSHLRQSVVKPAEVFLEMSLGRLGAHGSGRLDGQDLVAK
jgi:hypothetical protein